MESSVIAQRPASADELFQGAQGLVDWFAGKLSPRVVAMFGDIDDAKQELSIELWRCARDWRGIGEFNAYVLTAFINRVVDARKSAARQKRDASVLSLDSLENADRLDELATREPESLDAVCEGMPEPQAYILRGRFVEGRTLTELGTARGKGRKWAQRHYNRAIRRASAACA